MLVERIPLSEASTALFTLVRFGPSVDVRVVSQVFFGRKAFPTGLTHEGLLS